MEMKVFAHLGMPKTLTSALQEAFFSKNKDIHFLGVGVGSLIDYVDDDINVLFETLIPYASERFYGSNRVYYKKCFDAQIDNAIGAGAKWVGVSSEWLGFNFSPEMVDAELKIRRLSQMIGQDARILFIIRDQKALLKSLYAELVKVGYSGSFQDYCAYLWNFRDRGLLDDYCYDVQFDRLSRYFDLNNLSFLPLEHHRKANGDLETIDGKLKIVEALCGLLGLEYPDSFSLPKVNPSLNQKEILKKRHLNRGRRHDFGNFIFEPSNIHRGRMQLKKNDSVGIDDYFRDVKVKRMLIAEAKKGNDDVPMEEVFSLDPELSAKLDHYFAVSNRRFQELSGIQLPEIYPWMHSPT